MKTIEERAKKYASKKGDISLSPIYNEALASIYEEAYIAGATEQKAIDDAKWLKIKSSWEKEAQINHDDELNYKQGYHDAIEKACKCLEKKLQKIAVDEVKENFLENNFNLILKSQVPVWLTNFRKAMEE